MQDRVTQDPPIINIFVFFESGRKEGEGKED